VSIVSRQSFPTRLLATGFATLLTVSSAYAADTAKPQPGDAKLSATFQTVEPGLKAAMLPALYASSHAANLVSLANGDLLCSRRS